MPTVGQVTDEGPGRKGSLMPIGIVAGAVGVCLLLLILGFLVPRWSRKPQRETNKALGTGARAARKAGPGRVGRWMAKPFHSSSRMADRSAATGRKARRKAPF